MKAHMIAFMQKNRLIGSLLTLTLFIGFNLNANPPPDFNTAKTAWKEATCFACHSLTSKKEPSHVGPALYGVTKKKGRTEAWLIHWISDPDEMIKTNALAQTIKKENGGAVMTGMLKMMNKKSDGTPDLAAVKTKATALYHMLKYNDSKPEGDVADEVSGKPVGKKKKKG